MLSFRQKIFFGYLGAFVLFIILMYPFATRTVQKIAIKAMRTRAQELINKLQKAQDEASMKTILYSEKYNLFFRASLINDKLVLVAETPQSLAKAHKRIGNVVTSPEILEAFKEETGYRVRDSNLYGGRPFVYLATRFEFLGQPYVLRVAFPEQYVKELTRDFEIGATAIAGLMLLMFSLITWFIINHITRPIQDIISAVIPYQEGETIIPEIKLKSTGPKDEFGKLADTLNSLSTRIQKHIDTLTFERNEKEAVLQSLVEGVVAIEPDMTVTYINGTALRFLGATRYSIVGRNFEVANQPQCYNLVARCLKEGRMVSDTISVISYQQKLFIDIVASPIKHESGAILVMQDKTSHYKLLEMRKDFIANASHELKTPITIIRGFAETLHDNLDLGREMVTTITEKIVRNCKKMTDLIKDLLALTDVENLPESRLIECDLLPIMEECVRSVQEMFVDAKIRIKANRNISYEMIGDPSLLELAFTNLIENGAKYSEGPADITVTFMKRDDWIIVRVSDKGVGIPQDAIDHVFHRFYRVEKTRQKVSGSGLGLSIVEMIVEKHFGKISVTSQVGEGSTFTVQLPTQRYRTVQY